MRARVVVGTGGSLGSLAALHRAAAEARARDAELWVVLAWQPPGGGLGGRNPGGLAVLDGCRMTAADQLLDVLGMAYGGYWTGVGPELPVALTVRGTPGAALVDAVRDSEDLIVVGSGKRGALMGALRPSVARYCLAHAPCPVLAVPPSPLQADLAAVRRRNTWRMPLDASDVMR